MTCVCSLWKTLYSWENELKKRQLTDYYEKNADLADPLKQSQGFTGVLGWCFESHCATSSPQWQALL